MYGGPTSCGWSGLEEARTTAENGSGGWAVVNPIPFTPWIDDARLVSPRTRTEAGPLFVIVIQNVNRPPSWKTTDSPLLSGALWACTGGGALRRRTRWAGRSGPTRRCRSRARARSSRGRRVRKLREVDADASLGQRPGSEVLAGG